MTIKEFLDERDLGRPLSCEACPIREVCTIFSLRADTVGAPSTDSCRTTWGNIREWVDEEEQKELKHFQQSRRAE